MDDQLFIDRLRENIPAEVEADDPLEQLREFSQWLLIVPVIMLILFGCGQLAIFTSPAAALGSSGSALSAEYAPWPYVQIHALRSEIVEEIKMDGRDAGNPHDSYNDPVSVTSGWVEGELPPIIIAQLPTAIAPTSTTASGGAGPESGIDPTPSSETSSPTPSSTLTPWPTATSEPTSTDNPSATRTYTPTPSLTPTHTPPPPTNPGDATSTPSPTPTNTATSAPPTSTNTPIPPTPTDTPPPDYCSNISWQFNKTENWQEMGTVIKFFIGWKNNNSIPMNLTSYSISWTDNGLSLHRAKTIISGSSNRPKLLNSHGSSPASNCVGCPVEYPANSGTNEIYNMFCVKTNCTESADDDPIAPGTYNFTATGTFTFYGTSTVNCNFSKSNSQTIP